MNIDDDVKREQRSTPLPQVASKRSPPAGRTPGETLAGGVFGRRVLLKRTLMVAGGLLAVGAYQLRPLGLDAYGKLQILSTYEADVLFAFAEAVLPSGAPWPSIHDAEVVTRLDEELYFLDPSVSSDFKSVLTLLEVMPFRFGFMSRFSRMSRDKRLQFLKRTSESEDTLVNVATNAARSMVSYMYYAHEKVWPVIGYDGPFAKFPQKRSEQREYYQQLRRQA